jgi:hypothetical protein
VIDRDLRGGFLDADLLAEIDRELEVPTRMSTFSKSA